MQETNTQQGLITPCPSDSYEGEAYLGQLHSKTCSPSPVHSDHKTWLHSQQLLMIISLGPKFLFENRLSAKKTSSDLLSGLYGIHIPGLEPPKLTERESSGLEKVVGRLVI